MKTPQESHRPEKKALDYSHHLFGNDWTTVMPLLNPGNPKREMPFSEVNHDFFRERHRVLNERLTETIRRKTEPMRAAGEPEEAITAAERKIREKELERRRGYWDALRRAVEDVRYYTGMTLRQLENVAQLPDRELEDVIEETRQRMLEDTQSMPFLKKHLPEYRDEEFRKYGRVADDFTTESLERFMPHYADQLGLKNQVQAVNDPARLLLMMFDKRFTSRVRFEARRKLLLMKILALREDYDRSELDEEEALSKLVRFMDGQMAPPGPGLRGESRTVYMASRHEPVQVRVGKRRTTAYGRTVSRPKIKDRPPERIREGADDNLRVTPLTLLELLLRDEQGRSWVKEAMMDLREKGLFDQVIKCLRYFIPMDSDQPEHNDNAGIRLVFATAEEADNFQRTMIENIRTRIRERLEDRLKEVPPRRSPSRWERVTETVRGRFGKKQDPKAKKEAAIRERLETMEESVRIMEGSMKDNLTGDREFRGHSESSSGQVAMRKFRLMVHDSDGKKHVFEFQLFLLGGYADYKYAYGICWDQYSVRRFFEGVGQMLFPPAFYPGVDFEHVREKMEWEAWESRWASGAEAVELYQLERQKKKEERRQKREAKQAKKSQAGEARRVVAKQPG